MTSSYLVGACTGRSAGFLALEDAIDVAGGAAILVDRIRAVGNEAATSDVITKGIDRGQSMAGRQRQDQVALKSGPAGCHDQSAVRGARECCDAALDLGRVARIDRTYLDPKRRRRRLHCGELGDPGAAPGIPDHGGARDARRDLLKQLQPFPADGIFERSETGSVTAGPC